MVDGSKETSRSYLALIAYFEKDAPKLGKPQKRNRLSALSQFRSFCGAEGDLIGEELGTKFETHLQGFLNARKDDAQGTLRNLKSQLRAWKLLCEEFHKPGPRIFKSLREAVSYHFEQARRADPTLTYAKLGCTVGMAPIEIRRYLKSSVSFTARNLPAIRRLETALHASQGALTAFVSQSPGSPNTEISEFGQRQARLIATQYRLKAHQYHDRLRSEWRTYFDFKTDAVVMGNLKRNMAWRLRPVAEAGISYGWVLPHVTTRGGKYYAATAQIQFGLICVFFGALAQIELEGDPGVMKYEPRNFSLSWMTDYRLIKECMDCDCRSFPIVRQWGH